MLYGIIIFLKKDGVMIFRIISSAHNCQMTKRTIIVVRIFRIGEIFPPEFTKFGIFWKKVSRCGGVLQSQIFEILQRQKYRESNLPLCLGNNTIYIYTFIIDDMKIARKHERKTCDKNSPTGYVYDLYGIIFTYHTSMLYIRTSTRVTRVRFVPDWWGRAGASLHTIHRNYPNRRRLNFYNRVSGRPRGTAAAAAAAAGDESDCSSGF